MDAVTLSRINTVIVVSAVGGVVSHVWYPFLPGTSWVRPTLFLGLMAVTGAFRGWRELVVRGEDRRPGALPRTALLYAIGSVVAALLGYVGFHGLPG